MRRVPRIIRALFIGALFVLLILPISAHAEIHTNILKNVRISSVDESLQYLAEHQDISGGITEENDSTSIDRVTAWATIAFASAGYDPATVKQSGGQSLVDYISSRACTYSSATDIERTILALAAADVDLDKITGCDLQAKLDAQKDPSGKIGPDIMSTIFGALAYSSIDAPIDQTTINFIINKQNQDSEDKGGWISGCWDFGCVIETDATSQAIMALAAAGYKSTDVISAAKEYIRSEQTATGGIKYMTSCTDSDSWSDAYALQAIYALGESPTDSEWIINGKSILDDIARFKKNDNSYLSSTDPDWGDTTPVWTTSIVIPALAGKPLGWRVVDLKPYGVTAPDEPIDNSNNQNPTDQSAAPAPAEQSAVDNNTVATSTVADQNTTTTPEITDYTANSSGDAIAESAPEEIDVPQVLGDTNTNQPQSKSTVVTWLIISGIGLVIGAGLSIVLGRFKLILPMIIVAIFISIPAATSANRAAVYVRHGDGSTNQKCVDFSENSINGFKLLQRGGLNPILDRGFLVSINGEKAKTFDDIGSQNDYWSYWRLRDGSWIYSKASATSSKVSDGDVDGWQRGGSGLMLSTVSFNDICPPVQSSTADSTSPPAAAAASTDDNPPPAPTSNENNQSANSAVTKTDSSSSTQTAVNNDQELASVKGASTIKNDDNTDQPKTIAYAIPIVAASIVLGFIIHRAILKWKFRGNR